MSTTVYKPIVSATQVEEVVSALLKKWFPSYIAELARQHNWPEGSRIPVPKNYTKRNTFDAQDVEQLPKVVVISPGLMDVPEKYEQGMHSATWQVGVGIGVAAMDEVLADRLVKLYAAAARAILLQHQSLEQGDDGLWVRGVHWLDENYDDVDIPDQLQSYKVAGVYFGVEVENVTTSWAGPTTPTTEPVNIGLVEEVIITYEILG